jgi:hypothetical protein
MREVGNKVIAVVVEVGGGNAEKWCVLSTFFPDRLSGAILTPKREEAEHESGT